MGDSIEQWRATIGQWSGGRLRKWVTSQHHIAQTSDQVGYKYIRFLVLISLLVIGCVELNPGPDPVSCVIRSNKLLCVCKAFLGKIIQVRWKMERQIMVYLKL